MGFGVFKVNHLPLVVRCRERKNLLKAAADHRYALAAAHVEYFVGLKDVGEALSKFVHENLVYTTPSSSSSPTSSPVSETKSLNLTSDSDSDDDGSHLHFSDDEPEKTWFPGEHGHGNENGHYPGGYSGPAYNYIEQMMNKAPPHRGPPIPARQAWGPPPPAGHSCRHPTVHYMTTTPPAMRTVIHEATTEYLYEDFNGEASPPPAGGSAWDFLDVSNGGGYGYHPHGGYGRAPGVISSSHDLEEEIEAEVDTELVRRKKGNISYYSGNGDGTSKHAPLHKSSDASSKSVPVPSSEHHNFHNSSKREHGADEYNFHGRRGSERLSEHGDEGTGSVYLSEDFSSSPDTESSLKDPTEKEVNFSAVDDEIPEQHPTEIPTTSARDLREVAAEIRDEFATASRYGIQVAAKLEVGKLPYQQSLFREMLSRMTFRRSSSSYKPSASSRRLAAKTSKLATSYLSKDNERKPRSSLSSTLEALYVWEKKLYQEVKAEEKLRLAYEKQCKRLRHFDETGAESDRIDVLRASIRELNTKLKICMKTIDAISTRIHKLRDEVLQPQLAGLICAMIAMWKSMFGCHQKQCQEIMVCEMSKLKASTGFQNESGSKASRELEMELRGWSSRLNDWINEQKSFVQSINGWLTRCLEHELEENSEAPPIFSMCKDWLQAMEIVSNTGAANAMHTFASSLHQLSQRQDEEQRQRAKARDFIPKEVKKRLRKLQLERGRTKREVDAMCDKTLLYLVLSEKNGAFDELKVDLQKRLAEERAKHKEAIEVVCDAVSSSVRGDLVPLFKALEGFSLEALKVHQQVRLKPDCTALFN